VNNLDTEIVLSPAQFINYIQCSPIGYLVLDSEGRIIAINQLILNASEFAETDLVNRSYDLLINFSGTKKDFFEALQIASTNSYFQISWRDINGNMYISKTIVWRSQKEPYYYAIGFLEINRENNLSLLSRFAQKFVSENNIGIIVVDKDLHIFEISPLASKLLNMPKNQALNRNIDELFIGVPEEHRIVQKALLDGVIVNNHAATWAINQQKFDLLIDSNVIKDEKGFIVGAYVIFKDVTNLRSLEQQVRQNDRLVTIGQIAAGTAHEIRNPLTSVKGFLQILKNTLVEKNLETELSYTDIMLSEIERVNKLVNEILLLSKPKDMIYKPTDINGVIKDILPIIYNQSLLYDIEVRHILDKGSPIVIADSELLKQVFLNIAKNGIEALTAGGVITISTAINQANKQAEILIHDNGPGIPNYIADKIFEPFFTTKESGTGLGLSICQKIIHDLGGAIRVSTKGYGTTFQINLPLI